MNTEQVKNADIYVAILEKLVPLLSYDESLYPATREYIQEVVAKTIAKLDKLIGD